MNSWLARISHVVKLKLPVAQSCLTLCSLTDCSAPGSSVHAILQARTLQWVAIPFSRDLPNPGIKARSPVLETDSSSSEPFSWVQSLSCPTLCDPMDRSTPGLPVHHQLLEFTQTCVHPTISSSTVPLSFLQPFPISGSFQMSELFTSGGQSVRISEEL